MAGKLDPVKGKRDDYDIAMEEHVNMNMAVEPYGPSGRELEALNFQS